MTATIKAVIFDMGGVFIHTNDHTPRRQLAQKYGKSLEELTDLVFKSPLAIEAEKGLHSREDLLRMTMRQLGESEDEPQHFLQEFFSGDGEDLELVEFARTLHPRYKLGLLSNAFLGTREWMQERFTFLELFDVSFFSAEVGMRKPEEAFYHLILDALEVEAEEALFIDDFPENIEAA